MHLSLMISVFFHMALNYGLVLFHFTLQNSFEHFLYGRYNGIKLLQILFTWECLKFSSILKVCFTGYRILGWFTDFFLSAHWIYRSIVSWLPKFWWEIIPQSCWDFLLCNILFLYCHVQIIFVFDFQRFDHTSLVWASEYTFIRVD